MKRSNRYLLAGVAVAALVAVFTGVGFAVAGGAPPVVTTAGKLIVKINKGIEITLHFTPGTTSVASGSEVTFTHGDDLGEPHTISITTNKADLPTSAESPCKPCNQARKHFKNPNSENSPVASYILDKGNPGLDVLGDSILLKPKGPHKTATVVVSAAPGTTLYFVCAIHPWMQAKINVT